MNRTISAFVIASPYVVNFNIISAVNNYVSKEITVHPALDQDHQSLPLSCSTQ
jgi:hypothetical protein